MSVRDRWRLVMVRAGIALLQALIGLCPDWLLGRLFSMMARLAWLLTGQRAAVTPVADIADIFLSGPPHSTRVRKLVNNLEPETVASGIKCIIQRSPYGAL